MKITLAPAKPRNRIATAARARHAGAHRPTHGAVRQRSRHELRQTLRDLDPHRHSP